MKYFRSKFNGLHSYATIGTEAAFGLVLGSGGGDPALLTSTITHEEGHGIGMSHDKKGALTF